MKLNRHIHLLTFILLLNVLITRPALAEARQDTIQIDRVFVIGNRVTKEKIIKRELSLTEGQKLSREQLAEFIEADKNKIMNTRLFLSAYISVIDVGDQKVDLIVRVVERWYIFPFPLLELADRSFNEWWTNQNRDLSRINYGLKLYKYNMRGMNETLILNAQLGFTKLFGLQYNFPFIDRAQKIGLRFNGYYSENNNLNYLTLDHRLQDLDSIKTSAWMRKRSRIGIDLNYRYSFYNIHTFSLDYYNNQIRDTVAALNPFYFLNGDTRQRYFSLAYNFRRDLRDFVSYPLDGFMVQGNITKLGLGIYDDIDQVEFGLSYAKYFDLGKGFYLSGLFSGRSTFPEVQPYIANNGIGFGSEVIRGYDLYVIEGQHYIMNKMTFKKRIFSHEQKLGKLMPLEEFRSFPIDIYFKAFFDSGYIRNNWSFPENANLRFTNKYIYGGGFGLDIVSFYDLVMRFEYSLNKAGESTFIFGIDSEF
jgi:outer membrane protein assembly factor BamA